MCVCNAITRNGTGASVVLNDALYVIRSELNLVWSMHVRV